MEPGPRRAASAGPNRMLMDSTPTDNPATSTPTVSVLMSVYNGGRYLRPCLDSLLAQTLRDVEYVIVDDGSKDDSPAVLREYAARDPRIKLTVRPNKGLTKTLNECFAAARGEFLARMDCDDVCYPDRFEKQVAFLRANPDVVCAGGHFDLIDEEGRRLTTLKPPTDDAEIQAQVLKGHGAICHPAAMIRASALRQIGGYCEDFKTAQDIDLWLRVGEVGKLANLPTPVLKFRLHESSVSESKRHEQRQSAKTACERAWKRRGIDGKYEADEPWRPGKDRASRHKYALQYGWWAFNAGENATARHYAWRAIKALPAKAGGWKLLAVAAVKHAKRDPDNGTAKAA
jgi:glycosyltransferase involved in cell wall biosynthesis